jgi:large subunit ribosomal protein L30
VLQGGQARLRRNSRNRKMKKLNITLKRSPIGKPEKQRKIIRAMGLRRLHQTVTHNDTPSIRGMIHKTSHMIEVSEG